MPTLTPEQELAKGRLNKQGIDTSQINPTTTNVGGGSLTSATVGGKQYQTYTPGTAANTSFQSQDLATRQSILKGNTAPTAPTATPGVSSVGSPTPTGVNAPGVIDRNNTVVGGGTVNPLGPTGGAIPTAGTPTTTGATGTPPATPGILTAEELSPDMQTYLSNNPLAKSQFDLVARQGKEAQAKFLQDAEKAVLESKKQIGYDASQAANAKAQRDLNLQQNFQQGATAINKAEQNMYYSAVSPVTSGSQQTAAHGQIRDMAKQIDAMVIQNGLQNDAYAAQTAENARRIVLDLDNKIGETLNKKLQDIDNGVKNGDIATPEQLDRIFKENSDAILKEVPQLTNFAVQQMSDLTSNFMNTQKELRARQDIFNKGANTYNEELSQVQGFAVDGNGNKILGATGQPIKIDPEAPIKPSFDDKTGQLITFSKNANGTIVGTATKVQGYTPAVEEKNKQIVMVDGKPYDVNAERFLNLPGQNNSSTPYTPPTGFESRGANMTVPVTNTGDGIEIGIPSGTKLDNTNNGAECGGFANDFGQNIPGYKPVGNSYESKMANKNSDKPVAGGMVMWTPGKFEDNGHIGVVEKVFADGSFQIYDSNYVAKATTNRRIIKPGDKEYGLIQQTGGFFDPSKVGGQENTKPLSDKQYTQYNQALSKFVADPGVKSFEAALNSGGDLIASLKSSNGPGDVGAVFQFMKTLDPSSTVREGEFALAAKSAGVWEQFKNIPANKLEGTILTDDQRKAFGKLAFEYVKNKAKTYDIKYGDLSRILKNQGIPEAYYPTKMSDVISQYSGESQAPSDESQSNNDWSKA